MLVCLLNVKSLTPFTRLLSSLKFFSSLVFFILYPISYPSHLLHFSSLFLPYLISPIISPSSPPYLLLISSTSPPHIPFISFSHPPNLLQVSFSTPYVLFIPFSYQPHVSLISSSFSPHRLRDTETQRCRDSEIRRVKD